MNSGLLVVRIIVASWFLFSAGLLSAQVADLSKAEIIVSPAIKSPFRETAIKVLQEEIVQRTSILLPLTQHLKNTTVIVLATVNDSSVQGLQVPERSEEDLPGTKAEGFRIVLSRYKAKEVLWLIGADERGILFSIGKFLSTADFSRFIWYL